MRPPPTPLAQPWWQSGRSVVPRPHRPSELKQSRAGRASRRAQPQPERNIRSRRTHPGQERPLEATKHWGLHHLRRRLDPWRMQATPAPSTSSSIPCTSLARCYGTQGRGTPCLKKLLLALLVASRKLRHYFQGHPIKFVLAYPLERVLRSPNSAGRVAEWNIELQAF